MKKLVYFLLLSVFIFQSCSEEGLARYFMRKQNPKTEFSLDKVPAKPDYSNDNTWFVKKDINETIDIFYVYPTLYLSPNNWNMSCDDSIVEKRFWKFTVKKQLSIFDGIGNIYAPKYRQASLYCFVDKDKNGEKALDLAYEDVRRAFYYYFEHFNNGKPFMLVGHSQGSMHLLRLLEEISKDPKIKNKIIVTYAIGWPVTKSYLERNPQIKMCNDSCQTGCVVSWNTEGKHKIVSVIKEPSVSVNPLTWKTDTTFAPKSLHKGAIFVHSNSVDTAYHWVSAQNVNGHLIISKPKNVKEIWMPFKYGNYHVHDFSMFYFNIQENAKFRKKCFWKQ